MVTFSEAGGTRFDPRQTHRVYLAGRQSGLVIQMPATRVAHPDVQYLADLKILLSSSFSSKPLPR